MPKRRRSRRTPERDRRNIARSRSATDPSDFDEAWFTRFREFSRAAYVDLSTVEDRRRWHPNARWPRFTMSGLRPRVLVVPQGHKLQKYWTYGGNVPLSHIYHRAGLHKRRMIREWSKEERRDRYGVPYLAEVYSTRLSPRVGFHLPWQVIVCVRRRRRREVMHALHLHPPGGRGALKKLVRSFARPRRNESTEVVC